MLIYFRFLATGNFFKTIGFIYRVRTSTVGDIVEETCGALWVSLVNTHMKMPTANQWKILAGRFQSSWNFPNVLMALVDADYCFIALDIGSYGSNSDGSVFVNSLLGQGLVINQLNLPPPVCLPRGSIWGQCLMLLWVMKRSLLKLTQCVHTQEKPYPLTNGFSIIGYPGHAESLKMPLEFWLNGGDYFKGVSICILQNVKK